jgi:transposase
MGQISMEIFQPMEWAPRVGQDEFSQLTMQSGFHRMKAMAKHRTHSVEFKRQVSQEYLAGETLHGLSNRHDISRQLIRVWVEKYQAGALDEDAAAADLLQAYEARIAALERLVGKQALELEFLKGALRPGPVPSSGSMSAIAGPRASASPKGAD